MIGCERDDLLAIGPGTNHLSITANRRIPFECGLESAVSNNDDGNEGADGRTEPPRTDRMSPPAANKYSNACNKRRQQEESDE